MIGKEAFIVLEDYELKQQRIYEDACDFGVLATDQAKTDIRRALEELKCLDEHFKTSTENYGTGFTWKCKCQLLIESSYSYPGKYNGFKFTREKAIPISGDTGIKDIEKLAKQNKFKESKEKGKVV